METLISKLKLKSNFHYFGNKGACWSNAVHIAKDGSPTTLCGSPMLASNAYRNGEPQTNGEPVTKCCAACVEILNKV